CRARSPALPALHGEVAPAALAAPPARLSPLPAAPPRVRQADVPRRHASLTRGDRRGSLAFRRRNGRSTVQYVRVESARQTARMAAEAASVAAPSTPGSIRREGPGFTCVVPRRRCPRTSATARRSG